MAHVRRDPDDRSERTAGPTHANTFADRALAWPEPRSERLAHECHQVRRVALLRLGERAPVDHASAHRPQVVGRDDVPVTRRHQLRVRTRLVVRDDAVAVHVAAERQLRRESRGNDAWHTRHGLEHAVVVLVDCSYAVVARTRHLHRHRDEVVRVEAEVHRQQPDEGTTE